MKSIAGPFSRQRIAPLRDGVSIIRLPSLFYAFDFMGMMGVAVADGPAGPYEFLGHVSWPDGDGSIDFRAFSLR